MRAGEMSALKWDNVDFERRLIKIVETRVYGEEGRPKTTSSYRDIAILPMVYDALKEQARKTRLRSKYVFLNEQGSPIEIETLRKNAWSLLMWSSIWTVFVQCCSCHRVQFK